MPTSRWFVKRDLDQCVTHVTRIKDYLARTGRLYEADNPKPYQLFCALMIIADTLETGLKDLRSRL